MPCESNHGRHGGLDGKKVVENQWENDMNIWMFPKIVVPPNHPFLETPIWRNLFGMIPILHTHKNLIHIPTLYMNLDFVFLGYGLILR